MMGRHQYLNEDEYEVNLKDFEPQPGEFVNNLTCFDLLKLLCQLLQCSYHELRNRVVIFTSCILYSN